MLAVTNLAVVLIGLGIWLDEFTEAGVRYMALAAAIVALTSMAIGCYVAVAS